MTESILVKRNERPKSPVHIHLTDETPVHVHVMKQRKKRNGMTSTFQSDTGVTDGRYVSGNLRRSTLSTRESRSTTGRPIRPDHAPYKSSTAGRKYTWQGQSGRLDIRAPLRRSGSLPRDARLHGRDSEEDEEEEKFDQVEDFEHKLDGLKTDVGSLKNEVERQKARKEIGVRNDLLETSCRALEEQEQELEKYKQELKTSDAINMKLRRSMEALDRAGFDPPTPRRVDDLQRKLFEVELESQAISKQVSALVDTVRLLKEDKRLASADSAMLIKHKELLEERLARFNANSGALRTLVHYQQDQDVIAARLAEQRDHLLARLAQSQDAQQELSNRLLEKEHENIDIKLQLDAQREENVTVSGLQSSLTVTRAHLQKQLKQKDGDCNRLAIQIRTLESQLAQERIDVDHLRTLLVQAKSKPDEDKEALKKATRVQKLRAAKSEDALEEMKVCVMERDAELTELRSETNSLRNQHSKMNKEKAQAVAELSALKVRISELENVMDSREDESRHQVATVSSRLEEKTGEISAIRLDNDRLRTSCASLESRLTQKDSELGKLRASVQEYQTLVEEYRNQMNSSRREMDESLFHLEDQKRETQRVRQEGEVELEKVKERLQARLIELEPIPDMLRATEMRLQEATDAVRMYELHHLESARQISELASKVDRQSEQLLDSRERGRRSEDDARTLAMKLDLIEKKVTSLEDENRELTSINAKREEALNQTNIRLEEKASDSLRFQRQLEEATIELRRLKEQDREKTTSAERAFQMKMMDVEAQLGQTRAEIARLKREKEETERRFNSQLYDIKDRLEQSHSTNRTMQNYIQFLKQSYATSFNDSALGPTTSTPQRAYPY